MRRNNDRLTDVDATKMPDSSKLPDLDAVIREIKAGNAPPRDAAQQVAAGLLKDQQAKLLADRYAYQLIDDATISAPHADDAVVALMAWSMSVASTELLTRRLEKALRAKPRT